MKFISSVFIFIVLLFSQQAFSQVPGNKPGDIFGTDAAPVEYATPDLDEMLWEDEITDSSRFLSTEYIFIPEFENEESVVWFDEEDEEGELITVITQEQILYDSTWVTYAEYYAVWDTRNVNPYRIDATEFRDTLAIVLYDSLNGFQWSMPLTESQITSGFGIRHYRWHYGTDLELDTGDPIVAAFDGVVRIQQFDAGGYGYYVLIRHYNGLETIYGHMSKPLVKVGQYVKAGELIGLGGSTGRSSGPHLHFEVRYEGNPIDPTYLFDFNHHTIRGRIFNLMPEHYGYLKSARKVYVHTVRSGESLGSISRKYRVPVSTICKLNGIRSSTPLKVGKRLRIR
jgi:murein DD-endopeptidase MepM/ murein hydrolase activator NlpD